LVGKDDFPLYLVFNLSDSHYGLLIDSVVQIVHMVAITKVTASPLWISGVIGFRGRVIPVVNLRIRFGLQPIKYELSTPIIILQSGKQIAGLIVDTIEGVMPLRLDRMQSPADLTIDAKFIDTVTNQEERVLVIPDIPRILSGTKKYDSKFNPKRAAYEINMSIVDPNDQPKL
jgi:purine-binding chemotaxis protein CheW